MESLEEVLYVLRSLKKKHGRVLSLNVVFDTLIKERVYESKQAISKCLRELQSEKKIRPVNFGVNIEFLEDDEPLEDVQLSLDGGSGWLKRTGK